MPIDLAVSRLFIDDEVARDRRDLFLHLRVEEAIDSLKIANIDEIVGINEGNPIPRSEGYAVISRGCLAAVLFFKITNRVRIFGLPCLDNRGRGVARSIIDHDEFDVIAEGDSLPF